jgi:hypothetical protein
MASSTLKIRVDDSEVDRLIEKLERATELATGLLVPYLRPSVQARDYAAEPITDAERKSDREFFAKQASPEGEMVDGDDGLTDIEREVSDYLCAAVTAFGMLDQGHPSESRDFTDGIHACQNQLAWRIVQRCFPKHWPVKHAE